MGYASDDLPDWLKDLGSSSLPSEPEPERRAAARAASEPVPDWMASPAEPPARPESIFGDEEEGEGDVPDWLAGIRQAEGRPPDAPPPSPIQPPAPQETDNGDWLESIRKRESGSLPASDLPADDGDFMNRIKAMQSEDSAGDEDASQDWLAGLPTPEPAADASIFGGESPGQPDWMSGIQGEEPPPIEDKPDWLKGVGSGIGKGFTGDLPAGGPAWMDAPDAGADDGPLWPAEESARASEAVSQEFPGLPKEPAAPSWLGDLQPTEPSSGGAFTASEFEEATSEVFKLDSGELPDWLAQISPEDALPPPVEPQPAARPSGTPFDTGDLAPAELPSWLQAMRPVGPVGLEDLPEAERGEEERIGPLAGLAGVLPAEPDIVQFGRPSSASVGLQLNDVQRTYAVQLAQMVAAEAEAHPPRRISLALPQRAARLAIAILMLLFVAAPTYLLGNFSSLPQGPGQLPPAEIQAALDIANGLNAGDAVLVAVDYQPALAGEVEAAAMGVIDHMIIQGARLVMLSTLPTGPGQIQHFMTGTQSLNHPDYQLNSSYYNLGYLSGGSAGLLQLANDPRAALPVQLDDGRDVWAEPALAALFRLRDFKAIVVLTDDADTARAWVEQVQPALVDPLSGATTPLLVVSSAQAEPLLYPYLNNEPSQIQGLVAGLRGAAYYEANIRELNARRYWDAYGAGLTLGVATIAVGAVLGLSRNLLGGRRKTAGGRK
ncbi:MAG: hypothetical protein EPO32_14485 [Anaerolineae bacterium]|nr:MAG: hypothetical protein EPO32_14485 [Anaerolineae bacterium]